MPQSVGCNGLIRQGAQLIQSPEQLLEDLGMVVRKKTSPAPPRQQTLGLGERPLPTDIDGPTRKVLEALSFHPTAAETLANQIGLASGTVYAGLLMLELSGLVARTHDGRWHKTKL
jgi:DNA processing protein